MKELIVNSKKHGQKTILVDDSDYEKLNKYKWHIDKRRTAYYARTWNGTKHELMHRLILAQTDPKIFIDHEDHNGLNNQKHNLRIATNSQNICNRLPRKNCTSKYLGVHLNKRLNKWTASIGWKGNNINLGLFENEEDAARKYDKYAKVLHGQFANLNFKSA